MLGTFMYSTAFLGMYNSYHCSRKSISLAISSVIPVINHYRIIYIENDMDKDKFHEPLDAANLPK